MPEASWRAFNALDMRREARAIGEAMVASA